MSERVGKSAPKRKITEHMSEAIGKLEYRGIYKLYLATPIKKEETQPKGNYAFWLMCSARGQPQEKQLVAKTRPWLHS